MPLTKGSVIECQRGRYRLLRKISEGGMGIVWQAESIDSKRLLIVKEPYNRDGDRRISVERLKFESEILRTINDEAGQQTSDNQQPIYTHVVRYVDSLGTPTDPLLVLEFIEGITMNNAFKSPLTENTALQYVSTLLNVAAALHVKGIVHRDISPSNIILNQERRLVLIDFGTCQTLRPVARAEPRYGNVIMKRGFSSPELSQGNSDERSDIFSIGATLFYLLTNRNPDDLNSQSTITNVTSLEPRISKAVSRIVEIAMSPNPDQRFQSASAMLTAIEETRSNGPRIVVGDFTFELKPGYTDVGRKHTCDSDCESLGFKHPPQIRIADPHKQIEKHHVRIWLQNDGHCLLEDLKSVNGTAIKPREGQLKVLSPFEKVELRDMDIVALAYSRRRGPYYTFEYRSEKQDSDSNKE